MITKLSNAYGKCSCDQVGRKAHNLARMLASGFPVPDGYILHGSMLNRFVELNGIEKDIHSLVDSICTDNLESVMKISEKVRQLIMEMPFPDHMANCIKLAHDRYINGLAGVRSSSLIEEQLNRSGAGQLRSILNVPPSSLFEAIKTCWSSLYSTEALWHRSVSHVQAFCAVIIQNMVSANLSGVAFSFHPSRPDHMLIEAGAGIENRVVDGKGKIFRATVRRRAKLMRKESLTPILDTRPTWQASHYLSPLVKKRVQHFVYEAERLFGFPVDMEWAVSNNSINIIQCRPIAQAGEHKNISPTKFELLWNTKCPLFYASLYLTSGYNKDGFIVCQKGQNHTVFVSKNYKHELSKKALHYYTKYFNKYKNNVINSIITFDTIFKKVKELPEFSTNLEVIYLSCIKSSINLWKTYFVTEYHSTRLLDNLSDDVLEQLRNIKYVQRQRLDLIPVLFPMLLHNIYSSIDIGNTNELFDHSWRDVWAILHHKCPLPPPKDQHWRLSIGKTHFEGVQADHIYARLLGLHDSSTILRGQSALKGWYLGQAEVIHGVHGLELARRIDAMNAGRVLITGSTGPELMLACRKAGAIVTDEGGIISHATLIARELGIPTIIDTKLATLRIKSGDWIEVDANAGIVKILGERGGNTTV